MALGCLHAMLCQSAYAVLLPLLLACGASGPPGSPDAGSSVSMARSSLSRDPASSIPKEALSGAVAANNAFALDLYGRETTSAASTNLLISPLSASLALTMTYAGAAGQTATQMAIALHFASAAGSVFDGQNALGQELGARAAAALQADQQSVSMWSMIGEAGFPVPSPSDYRLDVVNSVWGQQGYPWAQQFLDKLAKSYGAGVYLEDFIGHSEGARQTIDAWVSNATANKINELLPVGSIDSSTRLLLVNAIHLKLPWANPFDKSQTVSGTFTKADSTTVSASFMQTSDMIPYVDDGQAQIVALPLTGGQVSVVIALPHGDLAAYEAGLTAGSLTPPSSGAEVFLSLPKVSFTSPTISLSGALQAMGMIDAFDPIAADFSRMLSPNAVSRDKLFVSDVLQKAMIALQETGVEAAAATAVIGSELSAPPPPIPMAVNRPFVVAIVDVPTGAILFLGHIADPIDIGSP